MQRRADTHLRGRSVIKQPFRAFISILVCNGSMVYTITILIAVPDVRMEYEYTAKAIACWLQRWTQSYGVKQTHFNLYLALGGTSMNKKILLRFFSLLIQLGGIVEVACLWYTVTKHNIISLTNVVFIARLPCWIVLHFTRVLIIVSSPCMS